MSLGTIVVLIVFGGICVQYREKPKEIQWKLFYITLFISTFVNCGYAFKIGSITITYNIWCQILYIIGTIVFVRRKKVTSVSIRKKVLLSDSFLLISLIAGLVILKYSKDRPLIIPWTTRMDDIYYQLSRAEYPQLGYSNYLNLFYCAVFCIFAAMSVQLLYSEEYVKKLSRLIKQFFKILIVSMLIEFFINNLISPTLIRTCVRAITGVAAHGYDAPQKRFGMYGILQFFNESSYFCTFIILYLLLFVEGVTKEFNEKWIVISVVALLLSGATSAWIVILIAVLAVAKNILKKKRISKIINAVIISAILGVIAIIIFITNSEYISWVISGMFDKVFTYLTGSHDTLAVSGSIRHMGNQYAYNAFFKSIFWGWGIGTLRSYGLLPGALGCFGVVGLSLLLKYIKEHCNLKFGRQNMLAFIVLIVYSTSILSVGYLYDPAIILITFPFNALVWRKKKNV